MRADSSRLLVIAALNWATSVFSPDKRTHSRGWKVDDFAERLASRFARACLWHRAPSDLDGRRGYSTFLGHIRRSWKLDVYKSGSPSTAFSFFFFLFFCAFPLRPNNIFILGRVTRTATLKGFQVTSIDRSRRRLIRQYKDGQGYCMVVDDNKGSCSDRRSVSSDREFWLSIIFSFLATGEGPQGAAWTGLRRRETSKSWKG